MPDSTHLELFVAEDEAHRQIFCIMGKAQALPDIYGRSQVLTSFEISGNVDMIIQVKQKLSGCDQFHSGTSTSWVSSSASIQKINIVKSGRSVAFVMWEANYESGVHFLKYLPSHVFCPSTPSSCFLGSFS